MPDQSCAHIAEISDVKQPKRRECQESRHSHAPAEAFYVLTGTIDSFASSEARKTGCAARPVH
jgi:hypothetical protein